MGRFLLGNGRRRVALVVAVIVIMAGGLLNALPGVPGLGSATAAATDPVIVVGGDIACPPGRSVTVTDCGQGKTGELLAALNPNYLLPLGDSQYDNGSAAEYAGSYDVTGWGADKNISRPAAGNHEYRTTGAVDYYNYFGASAGDPTKGYYSWNITAPDNSFRWHLIALNSECAVLGGGSITAGCGAGSTQEAWLKSDLAANPNVCTIAYWHRPRFSSSTTTPSSTTYTAFWNDLYNAGADLVINGHAHDYERFNSQTSAGVADPAKGLREFVVGSGGDSFQTMGPAIANSVVSNASAFGVMKLTLHATTYDWQFVPAAGYSLSDSGSGTCHAAPVIDPTPPSAPTNVSGTAASANQVNLSWSASTDNVGVTNYNIYRGSNGSTPSLIATTTTNSTSYTDTSVIASTTYTYQVQAGDAAGNSSPMSAAATVTTPASADTTPPSAPSSLSAESVFYNEIDLGWNGSTDSGTGVSGYRVYRQGPGESTFTLLATTTGTGAGHNSYVDQTVQPSSRYSYYVSAFDGGNNSSSPSNTVSVATPGGPISHTYTFTASGDATIQQANPTLTGGSTSPLVIDNVPVSDALLKFDVTGTSCDTLTSAKLTLTDNADGSVKGGDIYTTGPFTESTVSWSTAPTRGALLNSLGAVASNSTVSVDVTLTVICSQAQVADNTAPSAPANLRSTGNTAGEVDLAWDASTDNIGVSEYHIYRGGSQIGIVPASSLSYQDTTVAASTSYSYTVRAFDSAGNSSGDSNTVTVTTPAGTSPPAPPTNLVASLSGTSVALTWTASTSGTVTGYNIYRAPHGQTLVRLASSGTTSYTDTGVAAGSYDYGVTAVSTGGSESTAAVVTITVGSSFSGGITTGASRTTPVTTAAASWTVNLPAFSAGDFVVIWLGNNLGSTAGTPAASGWTTQLMTNESSGLKGSFLTRRMATGDPASITVTFSLATLGVAEATAFTGVSASTPVEAKAGQAEASTTAVGSHSTPSVTTVTGNDVLVTAFTTDNASTWTATDTELADAVAGTVSAAMYSSAPVAAGSYSRSATATTPSVKAVSSLLALRAG